MAIIAVIAIIGLAALLLAGGTVGSSLSSSLGGILSGNLSASDIAGYAQNAGFDGDDLTTAVAVALAESSGNPGAVGDLQLTPGGSIGLWQINLKAHPEYANVDLTDPQTNANAAYAIYLAANSSFSPWSTYKNNAYQAYLVTATNATQAA